MYGSLFSLFCFFVLVLSMALPAPAAVLNATNVTEFQNHLDTAAGNGQDDTINVAAGTYSVGTTLTYNGGGEAFSLTIAGAGTAGSATPSILDGGNAVQVMRITAGGNVTISGLTFLNGDAGGGMPGAGLMINGDSSGTTTAISDCSFEGNANAPVGGGLYLQDDNVTVTNSAFSGNTLTAMTGSGAGAFITANNDGTATISNCTFINNGDDGTARGGGLDVNGNAAVITDSTFSGNTIDDDGSGAALLGGMSSLTISGSTFSDNRHSDICDGGNPGGGYGAAADIAVNGPLLISGSTFSGNGVPCGPLTPGGTLSVVQHLGGEPVTLVDNVFFNNSSNAPPVGSSEGAISFYTSSGAVFNLTNNTFSGTDSGDATADIRFTEAPSIASTVNLYNNIFWGGVGDDTVEIQNNNGTAVRIFNNDFDPAGLTVADVTDYLEGGNQNIDPLFVDQVGGDLHITETSPVKDMGLNTAPEIPALDIDGDARILDGTVDIGADEFKAAVVPPPPVEPAPATFDPATGILHIPEVQLKATKAYDVELVRLNESGYVFELSTFKKTSPTAAPTATFSTKTGVLDILVVQIKGQGRTWHVMMQKRAGSFIFDLMNAKKN